MKEFTVQEIKDIIMIIIFQKSIQEIQSMINKILELIMNFL